MQGTALEAGGPGEIDSEPVAPALVILHGIFGTLDNWQTLARRWADEAGMAFRPWASAEAPANHRMRMVEMS